MTENTIFSSKSITEFHKRVKTRALECSFKSIEHTIEDIKQMAEINPRSICQIYQEDLDERYVKNNSLQCHLSSMNIKKQGFIDIMELV